MNDNRFDRDECLKLYKAGMSPNRIACIRAWTREDVMNVVRAYNRKVAEAK